jgi:hypothetical protein
MSDPSCCAELQSLRKQYEIAVRAWGELEFPLHNAPVATEASRFALLYRKQGSMNERNAAGKRLFDHQLTCPVCRRTFSKA